MLIPAYKDMDPYDLPEEFSHLQAQDMSKLGFMQDLIRGIKKIAQKETPAPAASPAASASGGSAPLLKRAFLFLEDGNWQEADAYCEKVLDIDPENAQAYLGKLMAELQVRKPEALKEQSQPFDANSSYQKAFRFGSAALKEQLSGCIAFISERNENARKTGIYNDAVKGMTSAHTEAQFNDAAEKFRSISGFKDADALAEKCMKRAEERRLEEERARIEAEKIARRKKKIIRITAPIVCVCIAFVILLTQVIIPKMKFDEAMALIATEDYDAAYAILEEIGKEETITANKHDRAVALIDSGNFNSAYELLREIGDIETINADKYNRAIEMMHSGEYTKASMLLKESGHGQEIDKIKYDCAMDLIAAENYIAAYDLLHDLDYEDSAKKLEKIMPQFCRA